MDNKEVGIEMQNKNSPKKEDKKKKVNSKKQKGNKDQPQENRKISCNEKQEEFCDNSISTSKYTVLTFIPYNLFEQFSKMANIYFLIIGLMQIIKEISISEGVPVIYVPLVVVVMISALKDLFEDLKRHKSDNEENTKGIFCYREHEGQWQWVKTNWKDLRVGEIIKLAQNEYLPCDILLLNSSEDQGFAFIETKNLDGETNLKRKQAPKDVNGMPELLNGLKNQKPFEFEYEPPNPFLYNFKGKIFLNKKTIPLNIDNFILRGCSIRNTKEIIGLASYTGHDTKIMLNSVRAKPKQSKVEKEMNKFIIFIFLSQIIMCFLTAIIAVTQFETKYGDDELQYLYIENKKSWIAELFIKWGTWILIFTNFVPISLLVTVEMVKFIQGIFISIDQNCKSSSGQAATVQASNLNEELGQVEYIFSDKTGTLTANIMKYKCYSVNGMSFGEEVVQKEKFANFPDVTNVDYWDYNLIEEIKKEADQLKQSNGFQKPWDEREQYKLFNSMMFLGVCHTIITDIKEGKNGEKEIVYNASSPDELALLNFAKFCGFEYRGLDKQDVMTVRFEEHEEKFKLLHILEFDSTRKRMSVVLKHIHNGQESDSAYLFTKGADSVIEKLLKKEYKVQKTDEQKLHEQTWQHLEKYGQQGLRTLLLAYKKIPKNQFDPWNDDYTKATQLIDGKEEAMDKLQTEIEQELDIVGATAIEDQLQDEVGQTIYDLKRAGIKVWVLTGDKIETAVNIGYSCKLLDDSLYQLIIDGTTPEAVQKTLDKSNGYIEDPTTITEGDEEQLEVDNKNGQQLQQINEKDEFNANNDGNNQIAKQPQTQKQEVNSKQTNDNNQLNNNDIKLKEKKVTSAEDEHVDFALLMTGDALIHLMANPKMQEMAMKIAHQCKAVMCCRVSPKQKQEVVTLVRQNLPQMTSLAIGDGANDVNMITAAHVGIGIRGVEGQQAARASDFAIGEFKILKELLLNHGRECYRKNTALICYNFYKNMLLVLPQWWYAFVNLFSGSSNYDPYIYQLYNIFYTSLPIVVYALFDQEFTREELFAKPVYYQIGLKSKLFNKKEFFIWIFFGVWQACVCGWFANLAMELNFVNDGKTNYFALTGMVSFHNSVLVGNLKILLFSYCYTYASMISVFGSILFFMMNHYVASTIVNYEVYNCFNPTYEQGNFWFQNIAVIGFAILIDMFVGRYRQYQQDEEYNHLTKELEEQEQQDKLKAQEKQKKQQQELEKQKQRESMGGSNINKSQKQRSQLARSYTGFGFSQTEAAYENQKSTWKLGEQ